MILYRIIKGFWGRYVFYLSFFLAVYFLMRNAIDNALYSLGSQLFGQLEGCHRAIAWIVLTFLVIDSIYKKWNQKATVVNQPLFAFVLVPVSAWYTFQILLPQTEKGILFDFLYKFILFTTLAYSNIIAFEKSRRLRLNKKNSSYILKDEPINRDSKDELGFTIYADSISSNIIGIVGNKRSFVFGIEGSWGSGKTSFINMVKARLKKNKEIRIVDFNPWMSSSAKQITSDFFKRMTEEVSDMQLKAKFREYGKLLAAADKTGIVEKVVDRICTNQDLGTMLESINYCIGREKLRFVVFIDDTDRLDKEELLAMFKLVRNTANFRNTVFVLTYDRSYVETVLEKYFDDKRIAQTYPDKIINFQFKLPSSARDYYEILKEQINSSAFFKAHPEIALKNSDLPKEYTVLFDNLRKVKRVFNALVVESVLPYFEKIPVKFTLIFFYIADYMKEEYEMIREAFNAANGDLRNNRKRQDEETSGKFLLRLIQESKGIYGPTTKHHLGVNDDEIVKINEERKKAQVEFERKHPLLYYLLNENRGNNPVVKYLDYLLKYNAIYFKKYKERQDKYGIDGFKRIELKLSNAADILNRLLIIRENFNDIFYRECAYDTFTAFTYGNGKISIGSNDLEAHFELLLALALSTSNPSNSLEQALFLTNKYFERHKNRNVNLLAILEKLDETDKDSPDPYIQHYTKFDLEPRIYIKSNAYREIIHQPREYTLFDESKVVQSAIKHLRKVIERNISYDITEDAFFACGGIVLEPEKRIKSSTKIDENACKLFKKYIEQNPDEFVKNCIKDYIQWEDVKKVSFHPLLMQIFNNSKDEVRNYFKNVDCKTKKGQIRLLMIQKYLEDYLSDEIQKSDYRAFEIEQADYNRIFSDSEEKEEAEEQAAHLEPNLQVTPTEVSK